MVTIVQWSFCFVLFHISLASGNQTAIVISNISIEANRNETVKNESALASGNQTAILISNISIEGIRNKTVKNESALALGTRTTILISNISFEANTNETVKNELEAREAAELKLLVELLNMDNDFFTTSRSLRSESDDYVPKEVTIAPTAAPTSANGSLRSQHNYKLRGSSTLPKAVNGSFGVNLGTIKNSTAGSSNHHRRFASLPYAWDKLATHPRPYAHQTDPYTAPPAHTAAWSARIEDDYFLPYMGASAGSTRGDWVFFQKTLRDNLPLEIGSTHHWWPMYRTDNPPEPFHDWCTPYHRRLGKICAYRMNQDTWTYNYKEFATWCDMEKANWPHYHQRYSWTVLNVGKCRMNSPLLYQQWSSQDGFWSQLSMQTMESNANYGDYYMKKIKETHFDYDYLCRSPWSSFTSFYITHTRACYYISWTPGTMAQAMAQCKRMGSKVLVLENENERFHIVNLLMDLPGKTKNFMYRVGIWWTWGTKQWVDYESYIPVNELPYYPVMDNYHEKRDKHMGEAGDCMVANPTYKMEYFSQLCDNSKNEIYYICKKYILYGHGHELPIHKIMP